MPGKWVKKTWPHDAAAYAPQKHRRACAYEAFIPEPLASLRIDLPAAIAGVVSESEIAIRKLNEGATGVFAPLARLLLRTESIASSKVEGLQMGVRAIARAEAQAEGGGAASRTALELIDNIDAMELAVGEASEVEQFTTDEIVKIHARLMQHASNPHLAGRIRTQQNWIGGNDYNPCGADFVPPPPEDVAGLLIDLCEAIDDQLLPPIVQAALVHAQFETIHPFEDGNGRTGRALVHVVLRRRGLAARFLPPISVVLAGARQRYIDGLTGFRGDRVVEWVEQFSTAAATAARLAEGYARAVVALQNAWRDQLTASGHAPRRGAAAWAIIDVLPAHPVITGPVATATTGRVKAAIYGAIDELVAAGVLIPLTKAKRNRAWEAAGLLELVERMESGEPPE